MYMYMYMHIHGITWYVCTFFHTSSISVHSLGWEVPFALQD